MKALRDILLKFLLITSSLLFALLVGEFGVRVFDLYRFPTDDFIEPHPELGWSHIPNKEGYWTVEKQRVPVKINSKGLRDREYVYEKEKGTFRILVLGDSFTEAFQVPLEDTFCKVMEDKLNKREGNFQVLNAGFAGVGTDYELLFYKREGYKYSPNLVIVAFFGNDISDNYRSKDVLANKRVPLAYEQKGLVVRLKHFLAENSCAYNYFGSALPKHVPLLANLLMRIGLLSFQPIDDANGVDQLHYLVFAREYGPEWERAWNATKILILELKKEVERNSGRIALISIPFREQVYEGLWRAELSKAGMGEREWDLGKPDRLLARFSGDAGIPLLELLPHFKKAAEETKLYHTADGHWNVAGHRLAGQIISDWLVEEKMVPIEGRHWKPGS